MTNVKKEKSVNVLIHLFCSQIKGTSQGMNKKNGILYISFYSFIFSQRASTWPNTRSVWDLVLGREPGATVARKNVIPLGMKKPWEEPDSLGCPILLWDVWVWAYLLSPPAKEPEPFIWLRAAVPDGGACISHGGPCAGRRVRGGIWLEADVCEGAPCIWLKAAVLDRGQCICLGDAVLDGGPEPVPIPLLDLKS